MDLKGKNIIYIGGFGGIGQKCLEAFLKKQVKVSRSCNIDVCLLCNFKNLLLTTIYTYCCMFFMVVCKKYAFNVYCLLQHLLICDLNENTDVLKRLTSQYPDTNVGYIPIDITKRQTIVEAFKLAASKLDNTTIDVVVNGCGLMDDRYIDLTIDINLVSC